jgi:hypothetical protein
LRAKQANRNAKSAAKKEIALEAEGHVDIDGETDDDDDDDDDSDDGSIAEDLGIETIIDEVDPYAYFKQSLTGRCIFEMGTNYYNIPVL